MAVVVAHPDDETIGAGAQLSRLPGVAIVHATDGAPRDGRDARAAGFASPDAYAAARRRELEAAMAFAGIAPGRLWWLGAHDQEASSRLVDLTTRLASLFAAWRTATVLTHAYEGGHPDHDAVAFAVHTACRLLPRPPTVVEMTGYHAEGDGVAYGRFLPCPRFPHTIAIPLSPARQALKRRMLACFVTQAATLAPIADAVLTVERFRPVATSAPAPAYDFTRPPHPGRLHYERHDGGLDGERWRTLAAQALDALGMAP